MAPQTSQTTLFLFAGLFCFLSSPCLGKPPAKLDLLHASCTIQWTFGISCEKVNQTLVKQIKEWKNDTNCDNGGEKCLYTLSGFEKGDLKAKHETPKKHYKDDLKFSFKDISSNCNVTGHSSSETWYAVLDYGTNYCNLHNLITGSGLNKTSGYTESTSDSICTQYTSANCGKY